MFRITESVFGGKVADILDIIDDVYRCGHDIKAFFASLTAHFRDLWVVKNGKDTARIVDAPPAEIERMNVLVGNVSAVYLGQLLDAFTREESAVKFSSQPRLALEMAFIRLFQIRPALPIETVLAKLDDLARRMAAEPAAATRYPAPNQVREPGPPSMARPETAASARAPPEPRRPQHRLCHPERHPRTGKTPAGLANGNDARPRIHRRAGNGPGQTPRNAVFPMLRPMPPTIRRIPWR